MKGWPPSSYAQNVAQPTSVPLWIRWLTWGRLPADGGPARDAGARARRALFNHTHGGRNQILGSELFPGVLSV